MLPLINFLVSLCSLVFAQTETDCTAPPVGWPPTPPQCCNIPFPSESMKKQFQECFRQSAGRTSSIVATVRSVRDARNCMEECVYKEIDFLKEDKTINKDELTKEIKKSIEKLPSWEKVIEPALDKCINGTNGEADAESACSSVPQEFTHCLMRQLFLDCPADIWKESDDCSLVKKTMEACPQIPPPPSPPPIPPHILRTFY